eukprot:scaffold1015_cov105-Pinguiococcus_pyrenoidosus.AAC.1
MDFSEHGREPIVLEDAAARSYPAMSQVPNSMRLLRVESSRLSGGKSAAGGVIRHLLDAPPLSRICFKFKVVVEEEKRSQGTARSAEVDTRSFGDLFLPAH